MWTGCGWHKLKEWCPRNYLRICLPCWFWRRGFLSHNLWCNYMSVTLVWIKKVFVTQEKSERSNWSLPHCEVSRFYLQTKNLKIQNFTASLSVRIISQLQTLTAVSKIVYSSHILQFLFYTFEFQRLFLQFSQPPPILQKGTPTPVLHSHTGGTRFLFSSDEDDF